MECLPRKLVELNERTFRLARDRFLTHFHVQTFQIPHWAFAHSTSLIELCKRFERGLWVIAIGWVQGIIGVASIGRIEWIVGVVSVCGVRWIMGIIAIDRMEGIIWIKSVGRVERTIWTVLLGRVENVVVALVLLIKTSWRRRAASLIRPRNESEKS